MMMKRLTLSVFLLAGCAGNADDGSASGSVELSGGPTEPQTGEEEIADDPCAAIRIAPDGVCDSGGPLAACDPDCSEPEPEPEPEGTGGRPSDEPCSYVRLAPDGVCDADGEYAACDPDCFPSENGEGGAGGAGEPESDVCAAVRPGPPDGECNLESPYYPCDPDCQQP